ncbi:MAG: hypothetical protein KGZ41_08550 [Dethiobacter sp.]|jgi:hypothetical protein|nr:hypothetical protein [Dethiobacter sp.]MBS3983831.1 hypothetical protein [Dethiobacter sp.]
MAAALFLLVSQSPHVSSALQAVWQTTTLISVRRHYLTWPSLETKYFQLRYLPGDQVLAEKLGKEADKAVRQVAELIPHSVGEKRPWLIVIPSQERLQAAFGWGSETGALGVYLAETIKILSPMAWHWYPESKRWQSFISQGPLVHEYTHFVLELQAKGNYPRWFSEGFAQLTEYHLLGYEWLEADSSLANSLYSLEELDDSFDALPRQALAYRQALSMVSYLEALQGLAGLNQLLDKLGRGEPFYLALQQIYGLNRENFLRGWEAWYSQDERWLRVR